MALLKLGLSLRIYSARVEMFTQMAENKRVSSLDCYNIINVGEEFTCSLEELEELVSRVSNELFFIYACITANKCV